MAAVFKPQISPRFRMNCCLICWWACFVLNYPWFVCFALLLPCCVGWMRNINVQGYAAICYCLFCLICWWTFNDECVLAAVMRMLMFMIPCCNFETCCCFCLFNLIWWLMNMMLYQAVMINPHVFPELQFMLYAVVMSTWQWWILEKSICLCCMILFACH